MWPKWSDGTGRRRGRARDRQGRRIDGLAGHHLVGLDVGDHGVERGGRAMRGESAGMVAAGAVADFRTLAWRALGMNESTDRRGVPAELAPSANATETELHVRGHNLLRRSNEVGVTDDTHPAFARILTEITPDEARILRFLYLNGPQPAIDVRTNRPLGIGSQLVWAG